VPGIHLAGVVIGGRHTGEIFIENGRFHGSNHSSTENMSSLDSLRGPNLLARMRLIDSYFMASIHSGSGRDMFGALCEGLSA